MTPASPQHPTAADEPETTMQDEVVFLREGYTVLMNQVAENKMRFSRLEDHFQEIMKTLGKRPVTETSPAENRRYVPESSNHNHQVPHRIWEQYPEESQLGYRSGHLNTANRDSMIKKIEMPRFNGTDATDWIVEVEHFFEVGRFRDSERLDLIAFAVEDKAKKWFAWVRKREGFRDWVDFKHQLVDILHIYIVLIIISCAHWSFGIAFTHV